MAKKASGRAKAGKGKSTARRATTKKSGAAKGRRSAAGAKAGARSAAKTRAATTKAKASSRGATRTAKKPAKSKSSKGSRSGSTAAKARRPARRAASGARGRGKAGVLPPLESQPSAIIVIEEVESSIPTFGSEFGGGGGGGHTNTAGQLDNTSEMAPAEPYGEDDSLNGEEGLEGEEDEFGESA